MPRTDPTAGPDADPAGGGPTRRGRRRARRLLLWSVAGLLVVGAAWVVVTAVLARGQLTQAKADLARVRTDLAAGRVGPARTAATSFAHHAGRAHALTTGPAWAAAAALPRVGDPLTSVRQLTAQTDLLATRAVPGLVAAAGGLDPSTLLRGGDTLDVAALARAAPAVHTARTAVEAARAHLAGGPAATWLHPVDRARATVVTQLGQLDRTLVTADRAAQVLPTMLGADGRTRRYFVGLQNEAEMRGTGGLPGAFAIASVTGGRITLERFANDTALDGATAAVDFGAAYRLHYAVDEPTTTYIDSNSSPHFPYAAQIWVSMWHERTGEQLDGALAVDPTALSYLLGVTGPAAGPDGLRVSAGTLVALTQKDVYSRFPALSQNDQRRAFLLALAESVEHKVLSGGGSPSALLRAAARGVSERRVLAWSADPAVQGVLAGAPVGGTVAATTQPYSQVVVDNAAGGKLDYYLHRSVTWARRGCGDTRDVTVTITLTSTAPASGLPPYVATRVDKPTSPTVPGQNRSVVDYVATAGATVRAGYLDGSPIGVAQFDELGHPSFQTAVELPPGATRTVVLQLREPAGTAPVTVVRQPGVTPLAVTVDDQACPRR